MLCILSLYFLIKSPTLKNIFSLTGLNKNLLESLTIPISKHLAILPFILSLVLFIKSSNISEVEQAPMSIYSIPPKSSTNGWWSILITCLNLSTVNPSILALLGISKVITSAFS